MPRSQINKDALKGFKMKRFVFRAHTISAGGLLSDVDMSQHACWYYCRNFYKNLLAVESGAQYSDERDHVDMQTNIALSVCAQYGLESPDDFLKWLDLCHKEMLRCELGWDDRLNKRPDPDAFRRTVN